jgi:hypothetical protein
VFPGTGKPYYDDAQAKLGAQYPTLAFYGMLVMLV